MKTKGFTLIELLVVIGIISLLVAAGIPNFLSARQRASDSRKKADMQAVKTAIRLYYNDYGQYPSGVSGGVNGTGNGLELYGCGADGKQECPCSTSAGFAVGAACDTVYMKRFPSGFLVIPTTIKYYQTGTYTAGVPDGEDFCLQTTLDNKSDPDIDVSQSRCDTACRTSTNGSLCYGLSGRFCMCAD